MRKAIVTAGRLALLCAIVLTALTGFGVQTALAQEFPGYTSGVQIANLSGSATATVSLAAYNADGSQAGSPKTDSIPANSSKTYFPIDNVPAGFSGSIVVGSNQSVAGIVNVLAISGSSSPAAAAYVGRSEGNTTVLLPLLNYNNGGYYTWYSIQNAGSAAATVSVAYSDGTNAGPFTIPAGAAQVVYQKSETSHTAKNFAGTVTSNQPIVASVIQENAKTMFSYTGFSASNTSTNPVFPLINANNSGYVTGVQLQNAGSAATDVTVSYVPTSAGAACTETRTIQPGASANFALATFDPNVAADPAISNCAKTKFVGSASVTVNSASQPLVGLVNQLLPGINGGAYGAFTQADAGQSVSMPLIMDRNGGYNTGFNVQNVGTSATNVTCTFQNNARQVAGTLQPGQALNDLQFNTLGEKYVGAATCTGDAAGSLLVATVNQLKPGDVDNLLVYEGVKLP